MYLFTMVEEILCCWGNTFKLITHGNTLFSTLRWRQNGHPFADNIFKCIFLNESLHRLILQSSSEHLTSIGSDNGLAPNRRQAIIWTNDNPVYWCIYAASHCLNELCSFMHDQPEGSVFLGHQEVAWKSSLAILSRCYFAVMIGQTIHQYWWVILVQKIWQQTTVNSLWPSDAIWWQRSGSTMAQVMACCLTAPSHHLNQCWLVIMKVKWHSSEGNFIRDTSATIL